MDSIFWGFSILRMLNILRGSWDLVRLLYSTVSACPSDLDADVSRHV